MKSILTKTLIKFSLTLIGLFVINSAVFSQDPGGSPDGPPPAVPIDDHLNLILAALGVLFALFTMWKLKHRSAAKNA